MKQFFVVAFLAFAGTTFISSRAQACDPGRCLYISLVAPGPGTRGVPLNARIWIGEEQLYAPGDYSPSSRPDDLRLVHETSGSVVPLTRATLRSGSGSTYVYRPQSLLFPETSYRIVLGEKTLGVFETGTAEDTTPPAQPEVLSEETVADTDYAFFGDNCGSSSTYGARYMIAFDGVVAVVDRDRQASLPTDFGEGTAPLIAAPGEKPEASVFLGNGGCWNSWQSAGPGSEAEVRFGTYDVAGNFSGFTEPVPVSVPSCGCTAGSGGSNALLLALGALAGRRWRKR